MSNLFSIFDYETSFLNLNCLVVMWLFLFCPMKFWFKNNDYILTKKKLLKNIFLEFKSMNLPLQNPGLSQFNLSLFSMIFLNNFLSLFPYIFSLTAHPVMPMSLMLFLWMGQYFYSWMMNWKKMLYHLVPQGTPMILVPLMVVIELISNLIRPLTLMIRLVANISAGHLLLVLISLMSSINTYFFIMLILVISASSVMIILELCVSVIQAYVFSMLLTLFIKEVNFEK